MVGFPKVSRRAGVALVLGFLLVDFAAFGPSAFASGAAERAGEPTISVSGTGSASAPPDIAVVRLGVETRNSNVKRALAEASSKASAIATSLERDGVAAEDITTVDYSVNFIPTREAAVGGAKPASPGSSGGPAGYFQVRDVAAVTVHDLGKLGTILDGALSAGVNEVQGVSFRLSNPAPLESRARAEAYAQAHDRALELATLSGVKLGRILRISSSESPPPISETGFRAAALAAPPVSPGRLQVSVSLQVVYAIQQ